MKHHIYTLLETWKTEGLVTNEQAVRLEASARAYLREQSSNWFISAILYVGAAALSLGFLIFIAANWEAISPGGKMVLAILLPLVPLCYAFYELTTRNRELSRLGQAMALAGTALIGGTLALIDQLYNLPPDMTRFFATWALLSLPFALTFQTVFHALLTAVLAGAAVFGFTIDVIEVRNLAEQPGVILMTLVAFVYAGILYLVGEASSRYEPASGRVLRISGALLFIVTMFAATFEEYARAVTTWDQEEVMLLSLVFNLVFVAAAVAAMFIAVGRNELSFAFMMVRVLFLYLIVKYFTLFYSMLDTGLFLIIGGAIFISGALVLERKKAAVLAYMKRVQETGV